MSPPCRSSRGSSRGSGRGSGSGSDDCCLIENRKYTNYERSAKLQTALAIKQINRHTSSSSHPPTPYSSISTLLPPSQLIFPYEAAAFSANLFNFNAAAHFNNLFCQLFNELSAWQGKGRKGGGKRTLISCATWHLRDVYPTERFSLKLQNLRSVFQPQEPNYLANNLPSLPSARN